MSSQHLRPFAAFVLVSLVCAFVMIHSVNLAGMNPMRPGGFAVVDGPRQVTASSAGARDLGQTRGPAATQVESVPDARQAASATPSQRLSREAARVAPASPSSQAPVDPSPSAQPSAEPTSQPSGPGGQPGGKPTAGPTQLPDPSRTVTQLRNRVANLAERVSRSTGPQRDLLRQKLLVLRLRLELAEIRAGIGAEEPQPPQATPGAVETGEPDPTPSEVEDSSVEEQPEL